MPGERYRSGDAVRISGGYQYEALTQGNAVQRFWHYNKQVTINKYLPANRSDLILDVGCGSGVISNFLAKSGASVRGIDGNPDAVEFAQDNFQLPNLSFERGLVDGEFVTDQPVDKVYCLEVLEHIYLEQGREMLSHFHRVLRPNGAVFLTTPNYRSHWPILEWLLDCFKLVPRLADDQHVEFYHSRKLKTLAISAGFQVERIVKTCFVAPWIAPISWKMAEKASLLETNSLFPGAILVAVLRKPGE